MGSSSWRKNGGVCYLGGNKSDTERIDEYIDMNLNDNKWVAETSINEGQRYGKVDL